MGKAERIRTQNSRERIASQRAAAELAAHAAGCLDHALLRPLSSLLADRQLVVVPYGQLQALPWPMLPSCAGRPLTVAP